MLISTTWRVTNTSPSMKEGQGLGVAWGSGGGGSVYIPLMDLTVVGLRNWFVGGMWRSLELWVRNAHEYCGSVQWVTLVGVWRTRRPREIGQWRPTSLGFREALGERPFRLWSVNNPGYEGGWIFKNKQLICFREEISRGDDIQALAWLLLTALIQT